MRDKFIENRKRLLDERSSLREKYGSLYDSVAAILFSVDSASINNKTNTDEYEAEAGTILPRLSKANSVEDVEVILIEEFQQWFGIDIGSRQTYRVAAEKIWDAWRAYIKI